METKELKIYTDAGCDYNGEENQSAKIAVFHGNDKVFHELIGNHSSNEAEFLAIYRALDYIREQEADIVYIFSDSKLAVNMLTGKWKGSKQQLKDLRDIILRNIPKNVSFVWTPREMNNAGIYLERTKEKPKTMTIKRFYDIENDSSKETVMHTHDNQLVGKFELQLRFLTHWKYNTVSEGWVNRPFKLVAIAPNKTQYVPEPVSFTDLKQYAKMTIYDILDVFKSAGRPITH